MSDKKKVVKKVVKKAAVKTMSGDCVCYKAFGKHKAGTLSKYVRIADKITVTTGKKEMEVSKKDWATHFRRVVV
jgi:proline dehydrogenase